MLRVKAEMSNEFRRHYDLYGHFGINKIFICREPLHKGIEIFVNTITFGKYSDLKRKLNYDEVFHLYLMILLSNGMWMLLEKNEQPVLKPSELKKVTDYQHIDVAVESDKITLREFIDNSIQLMGANEFFIYDSLTSNCQKFVTDVLISNSLWSTKYDLFVNQSINESLQKVSGLKSILRKITDVGAITKQILGKGGADLNKYFYIIHPADRRKLMNYIDAVNNAILNLRNNDHESVRKAINLSINILNFIGLLFALHKTPFYFDFEYTQILHNETNDHFDVELLLRDLRRIIEQMLKAPSPFAQQATTAPVLAPFPPQPAREVTTAPVLAPFPPQPAREATTAPVLAQFPQPPAIFDTTDYL